MGSQHTLIKIKADLTKQCKAKLWATSNHTSRTSFEQSTETFLSIYNANKPKPVSSTRQENQQIFKKASRSPA